MKSYALLITCTIIAGFSGNSFATLVGSPRPIAQENFQKLINTNECPSCDLAGVVLTRVDLSGANLEGANLAGAKMYLTNLSGANLKSANLQGAELGGADLAGADLRGANLTGAVLEGAYLKGAQIDGRIITRKPYETEELPGVSENKYVDDESRGKHVPYTQDVVIADRRDLEEFSPVVPVDLQVQQKETVVEPGTAVDSRAVQSKKLIPMADAVVHLPDSKKAADEPAAEIEEDTGLWGTVTSFFSGGSPDVEGETDVVAPIDQKSTVQVVDQPVEEIIVDRSEEIVITKEAKPRPVKEEVTVESTIAESDAGEPGPGISSEEKMGDSGFWDSVTSIFSSDDKEKETGEKPVEKTAEEMAVKIDEAAADTATPSGRDELAPDAGVTVKIEQVEEPLTQSDKGKVVEQATGPQEEIVVSRSEDVVSQEDEVVAVPSDNEAESDGVMITEPEKVPVAEEAIVTDEPDQVDAAANGEVGTEGSELAAGPTVGDMVYGVETPEQARANQQIYIDRLLDEDRCVECDLAGVDLSGKNLDEVDLERANLQGANLERVDLSGANLKGVNFSGANLKNADLREADLYLADFTGADLTGANLDEALIDSTDFTDATGTNLDTALKEE